MLLYEEILKKEQKITGFICDVCKTDYGDDMIELQECHVIDVYGGYGSIFGDGCALRLVICQHCLANRFSGFMQEIEGGDPFG